VPWMPELFSAPVLERIRNAAADTRAAAPVPYFPGLMSGETEALIGSFAGEPELCHPVRGRVKGRRAFEVLIAETTAWLAERTAVLGDVWRIITPRRGVEETVLTLDGQRGRVALPVGIVVDRADDGRINELRIYFSNWPLTGSLAAIDWLTVASKRQAQVADGMPGSGGTPPLMLARVSRAR
jgi:hypothetical protein